MPEFTKRAKEIFAPFDASGARRSVDNGETQIWGTEVERGMEGAAAGRVDASSWSDLSAIAGDRPGQPAIVYGPDAGTHTDPVTGQTVSNEGMYAWSDSPAGWRRVADVQSELVHADNVGHGSANAIQATVIGSFNRDPYRSLITLNFTDENTGAVTVSINGETPRPLVTNTGDPVPSGYLQAGMSALVQIDEDGNYRLFSYGDADAVLQAALQAAQDAQDAANEAALYDPTFRFKTVHDLLSSTRAPGGVGTQWQAGSFLYDEAASGATDHHVETAGGVKLYLVNKIAMPSAFGCVPGSGVDDYARLQKMFSTFKDIFIDGEYASSDAIELQSDTKVTACALSKITTLGTNKRVLFASGKTGITIDGLTVEGNLTGDGSTGATAAGGEGMAFHTCTDVVVKNCKYSKIGRSTANSSVSCLRFDWCDGIKAIRNTFLEDNGGEVPNTGADIQFGYYTRNTEIVSNKSYSTMDSFISGAAVSVEGEQTVQHIITNNYGERADGSLNRHGILIPYAGKRAKAIIANNILVNFLSTGIYMSAGASPSGDDETAGIVVQGNIIRWCGGYGTQQAGIYASGRGGVIVSGNIVEFCGYERGSDDARANASHGVYIVNTSSNITVVSNILRKGSGAGIVIDNTSSGNVMERLLLSRNNLLDNALGGLRVLIAGAGAKIVGLEFTGNTVEQIENDADGITAISSGALALIDSKISNNRVVGVSGSAKYGITSNMSGFVSSAVNDNLLKSWARGVNLPSVVLADKEIGRELVLSRNTFDTCATGISVGLGAGKYALHYDSTFINCTANVADAARILPARNLDGAGRWEIRRSAVPSDGTWTEGTVCKLAPTAGGHIGAVCTASGSPGTWKNYGGIGS